MSRRRAHPLREVSQAEHDELEQVSRSSSCPAAWVRRGQLSLLVEAGLDYLAAARRMDRRNGEGVAALVQRLNEEGLAALVPRHGGGPAVKYGPDECERIVREASRPPDRAKDGTATWSLSTLQHALQAAPDGLSQISRDTIRTVLLESGYSWQLSRTWCKTGQVIRKRKTGAVVVQDEDSQAKKN